MISTTVFALAIPGLGGVGMGELVIILAIVLLLFGPKRLPSLGKSIGKTFRSLKDGIDGKLDEGVEEENGDATAKKAEPSVAKAKKAAAPADDAEADDEE